MTSKTNLKEGSQAPEFCLRDDRNEEHCLSDYRGNWVVLYFYPKDNTPGCTTEAKDFSCIVTDFYKKGAVVIGVSADAPESHMKFRLKHDISVILLSDPGHEALNKYGVYGEKKMYGKILQGITRSTYLIDPEGDIRHVWPKVSVKGHAQEVLSKLSDIGQKSM